MIKIFFLASPLFLLAACSGAAKPLKARYTYNNRSTCGSVVVLDQTMDPLDVSSS